MANNDDDDDDDVDDDDLMWTSLSARPQLNASLRHLQTSRRPIHGGISLFQYLWIR